MICYDRSYVCIIYHTIACLSKTLFTVLAMIINMLAGSMLLLNECNNY